MPLEIYSTNTDDGTVTVARRTDDFDFERITSIQIGNAPRGAVKFTSDGRGFVSNCGGDTISEIDSISHSEVTRIKVGLAPRGIGLIPGDRWALVSNSGSNSITIVDLRIRQAAHEIAVGRDPRHMAVTSDGRVAFVAVWGSNYLAKIDTSSLASDEPEAVREVRRIPIGAGAHPYSVALTPDGNEAWVANTRATYVSIVNVHSGDVTDEIDVGSIGGRAIAFSPDGTFAYLSIENSSEIAVIDRVQHDVVNRIPVGPGPRGIVVDRYGTIYASAFARTGSESSPTGFSLNTLTVVNLDNSGFDYKEIPVGAGACSVSVLDLDTVAGASQEG